MKRIIIILLFLAAAGIAYATTWFPTELTDPLTGEKVAANAIGSFGGYIYNWPSKYDLVFWPLTDDNYICINPKNGYGAFNRDFETLPEEEKDHMRKWLVENYDPSQAPQSHMEKLEWLEKVYGQRKMEQNFWCIFYRLMAYMHNEHENGAKSLEYVKKALPILEKKLEENPEDIERLEVLYLLGEYNRRLGNFKTARKYFAKVKKTKYKDEDGKIKTGHPYFLELIEDREKLMDD